MQDLFEEYLLSIAEFGILIIIAKIIFSVIEMIWEMPL